MPTLADLQLVAAPIRLGRSTAALVSGRHKPRVNWLSPLDMLDLLINLLLDGLEVERGRCLHGRIVDRCLRQLEYPFLDVDKSPKLAAHELVKVTGSLVVQGVTQYRRGPLERVLADIDWRRHVRVELLSRPTVGLLVKQEFVVVEPECAELRPPEVEDFMPHRRFLTQQQIHLIVAVQVVLVGLLTERHAFKELIYDVGVSCRRSERGQPVEAGEYPVLDRARLNLAGPADESRYPEAAFEDGALGRLEWRHATVWPGEDFCAVIGGEDDNGVVGFADILQVLHQRADIVVQLSHAGLF